MLSVPRNFFVKMLPLDRCLFSFHSGSGDEIKVDLETVDEDKIVADQIAPWEIKKEETKKKFFCLESIIDDIRNGNAE